MPVYDDPKLLKYLDEAVALEKSSVDFYTSARNKASDFNMKSLLNSFLTVEINHLLSVTKVRDFVKSGQSAKAVTAAKKFSPKVPVNPFQDMVQLEKLTRYGSDIFSLFKGAVELEQKAESFYRSAAKNVRHPELRSFLLKFASDEKHHQSYLLKHKDAVYDSGYWLGISHVRLET